MSKFFARFANPLFALYLAAAVTTVCFTIINFRLYNNSEKGIFADPQGESVYLQGDSCTVNMESDDLDSFELYRRFDFCVQQHMKVHGR